MYQRKIDSGNMKAHRQSHLPAVLHFLANYPSMNLLQETVISCPYCGETVTLLVDGSVEAQQYIEDCEVCCRPIYIQVDLQEDGDPRVEVRTENE